MQHEMAGIVNIVFLFLGILGGPGSPFLESEEQRNNQKADSFARGKLIVPLERTWTQGCTMRIPLVY